MSGKQYKAVKEKTGPSPVDLMAAVNLLKDNVKGKFDHTVEVHINLGVNASKSDQMVRGSVTLPHGTAKAKRVVVFTSESAKQKEATAAGAAQVGGEELIKEIIEKGTLEADVTVATPDMMPKIAKAAKILGPKGLMPNPKTGTVTLDVAKAVKELASGKISFKMDATGNIHEAVAKLSWDAAKIAENAQALMSAVKSARPATQRGEYIKRIVLKSTMSPAVQISA